MWYVHKMEYYSAIERNTALIHGTAWIKPENIILSEIRQTQKTTYIMSTIGKSTETEHRLVIVRGCRV